MTGPDRLNRHHWVWLSAGGARGARTALEGAAAQALAAWLSDGRPLVVARRQIGDTDDDLRLGLALPGRRRVALHVAAGAIVRHAPPPSIEDVLPVSPRSWRDPLERLAAMSGTPTGVYGSLAWQHHARGAGLRYLTPQSDVDLLFRPNGGEAIASLLQNLAAYANTLKTPRVDGEILLPDGRAVAWREWASGAPKMLGKGLDTLEILDRTAIMAAFRRDDA